MALEEISAGFASPGTSTEVRELQRKLDEVVRQLNAQIRAAEARIAALEADAYTPGTAGDWGSSVPATRQAALDTLAANTTIP